MDKVLKSLKNNKTKEHNVMINEILKPGYWRRSEISFDYLFNGLMYEYVSLENISSIYKSKGSRLSMENERGIFILTVMKKILDKLMYFGNIEDIDDNMGANSLFQQYRYSGGKIARTRIYTIICIKTNLKC